MDPHKELIKKEGSATGCASSVPLEQKEKTDRDKKETADDNLELKEWIKLLNLWKHTDKPPAKLCELITVGIPDYLRAKIWLAMVNGPDFMKLAEMYKLLLGESCDVEEIIRKDLGRTFPAQQFFRTGPGQHLLFNVCKAYSNFDTKTAYIQGFNFIIGCLLFKLEEEDAFKLFVVLMEKYKLKQMYEEDMQNVQLKCYQIDRMIKELDMKLWDHFNHVGVQAFMFSTQWLLTLYAAKFPLFFSYHVMDMVLLYGVDVLLQISLAILQEFRMDLLSRSFPNVMQFLSEDIYGKMTMEISRSIMANAANINIKHINKYEKEYLNIQAKEKQKKEKTKDEEIEQLKFEVKILKKNNGLNQKQIVALSQKTIAIEGDLASSKIIIDEYKAICRDQSILIAQLKEKQMESQSSKDGSLLENANIKIMELEASLVSAKLALAEADFRYLTLEKEVKK